MPFWTELPLSLTAADIFGMPMNTTVESRDDRISNIMVFLGDPELYVQRIRAAVDAAKQLPMANPDAIALAGYCFGGAGVVFDVMSDSAMKVLIAKQSLATCCHA